MLNVQAIREPETMPSQIAAALSGGAMPHRTHNALPSSVYTFSSLEWKKSFFSPS